MQEVSATASLWKVALSLLVIIAFIPASLWLLKRFQLAQMKLGKTDIKILSVQSLGTKEKLMLVEVENEKVLLGVTSHTITHLKSFPKRGRPFDSELVQAQHEQVRQSQGDDK
ncbi:flagellar biosynthetic protein FliO [Marinomonas sp. THO17]|uniref:flagellar biosynthetic protein FliO n=1 Tax=Marinomonas sp. THO17 TaxID=3149048 RepID=UPI00336BD7FF